MTQQTFRKHLFLCFYFLFRSMWSRSRSLLLKIEIHFPLNNFSLLWPIDTKLATNATNFFFTAIIHFLFLSHQYLVESLKTWFRRIAALFVLKIYRPSSKIYFGSSKSRSPGQIFRNMCLQSRCHICNPILMKLHQNVCFENMQAACLSGKYLG